MKLKWYGFPFEDGNRDEYFIVRAFSEEHVRILWAEHSKNEGEKVEPTDLEDVDIFLLEDIDDILIDYNYITYVEETISLSDLENDWDNSGEDIYGVVGNNFG